LGELASNILFRALLDWAAICRSGDYPVWSGDGQRSLPYWQVAGFEDACVELKEFFYSDWCKELARAAGGDGSYYAYLEQVGEIKASGGDWHERRAWKWRPCQP